jgi:hypothetical protein
MNIIIAEFYNNEGFLQTTDVYELPEDTDTEYILDFVEFTKQQLGHSVIKRNKVNILFTDGIRLVLRKDELIHMADVKQYVDITKNITPILDEALKDE